MAPKASPDTQNAVARPASGQRSTRRRSNRSTACSSAGSIVSTSQNIRLMVVLQISVQVAAANQAAALAYEEWSAQDARA